MRAKIQATYVATPKDIEHKWLLVDAKGQTLGRLASRIAHVLRGKHKPTFTPNLDTGDFVVVINCAHIHVTRNRMEVKLYRRYSGYPGGLHTKTLRQVMNKYPERALKIAVKRMLPKGPLGHQMLGKLKLYAEAEHPHAAQKPEPIQLV